MYADVILKPIKKSVKTVGELIGKEAPQIPNFVNGIKSGGRGVVVTAKEWVGKFFKSMAEKFSKEADNFVRYVDKVFGEAAEETIENGSTSGGKWIDDLAESGDEIFNGVRKVDADFVAGNKLTDYFNRHGADFGYSNADEYLDGARNFMDKSTNGRISIYFKPTDGYQYWLDQVALYK